MKCSYYLSHKSGRKGKLNMDDILPGFSENPMLSTMMLTDTLRHKHAADMRERRLAVEKQLYQLYYTESGELKEEYADKSYPLIPFPLIHSKGWRCPDCQIKSFDPDTIGKIDKCPNCGHRLQWPEGSTDADNE